MIIQHDEYNYKTIENRDGIVPFITGDIVKEEYTAYKNNKFICIAADDSEYPTESIYWILIEIDSDIYVTLKDSLENQDYDAIFTFIKKTGEEDNLEDEEGERINESILTEQNGFYIRKQNNLVLVEKEIASINFKELLIF